MSATNEPKRLHYAGVVGQAFMLLVAGLACLSSDGSAGFSQSDLIFVLILMLVALPFFGGALSIWLFATWLVFDRSRRWRGRTWVALLPALVFFGHGSISIAANPPSPQKQFKRLLQVDLPEDARNIEVSPPTFADSGHRFFGFQCSKQSTMALITALALEPLENMDGMELVFYRSVHTWSKKDWEESLHFVRTDPSGTGYILVTDASMQQVLVARDPLWGKSEDELNNGL